MMLSIKIETEKIAQCQIADKIVVNNNALESVHVEQ